MLDPEMKQEIEQAVQQAVQAAATQTAAQVAQQVSEQISQSVSAAISKVMQSQTQTTGATMVGGREELGDIGGTERLEKDQMADSGILFANMKRTYDEYQHESLESVRRNRSYVDKVLSDAQQHDNHRQDIANQALQNAVETANMVGKNAAVNMDNTQKQHARDVDISTDRIWNVDEQGWQVTEILRSNTFKDAVAAAASEAVQSMLPVIVTAVGEAAKPKA